MGFEIVSNYKPMGDQPKAIKEIVDYYGLNLLSDEQVR